MNIVCHPHNNYYKVYRYLFRMISFIMEYIYSFKFGLISFSNINALKKKRKHWIDIKHLNIFNDDLIYVYEIEQKKYMFVFLENNISVNLSACVYQILGDDMEEVPKILQYVVLNRLWMCIDIKSCVANILWTDYESQPRNTLWYKNRKFFYPMIQI